MEYIRNIIRFCKSIYYKIIYRNYQGALYWEKRATYFMDESYQQGIYEQHERILEKFKHYKPKNILEIGCGFGRNIKFLIEHYSPDVHYTGTDISETMIQKAKEYLHGYDNVNLYTADILSTDNSMQYDIILIHGVFMHIKPEDFSKNRTYLTTFSPSRLLEVEEIRSDKNQLQNVNINGFTFAHDYLSLEEDINEYKIKNNLIYLDITL